MAVTGDETESGTSAVFCHSCWELALKSQFSLAVFEIDWVILNFNRLCSENMNGQTAFQMLKQNFEVLIETQRLY